MVQRRTFQRQFFLIPKKKVSQIFLYILGYTAKKYGIQIHEFVVLSNHYHIVLTDVLGNLPAFMLALNSLAGKALNAYLGRTDKFWTSKPYCAVQLLDTATVMDSCVYTQVNPVKAGLVAKATLWGGVTSASMDYGDVVETKRPSYFRKHMPEKTSIALIAPPKTQLEVIEVKVLANKTKDDRRVILEEEVASRRLDPGEARLFRRDICVEVHKRERDIAHWMKKQGRSFMGMNGVLRQRTTSSPQTNQDEEARDGVQPTIKGRDKWSRLQALQRKKAFLDAYIHQLEVLRNWKHKVGFPYGTYGLVASGIVTALGS